jgi:hypothetical protein
VDNASAPGTSTESRIRSGRCGPRRARSDTATGSLENRPGVVFLLDVTDIGAAQAMLEALPLGKAHLMTFELYPIGPLNPLRQLLKSPEAH